MEIKIRHALASLYKDKEYVLRGDDYSGLEWLDNSPKPTEQELLEEIVRLESLEYQRLRAPEYPSIGDQLDALFHAGVFPPEMAAQIQAVKDKYPKGS
jgi:hypothetical protein